MPITIISHELSHNPPSQSMRGTLLLSACYVIAQMVKESVCNKGDQGSIPGLGRSSGEGRGNPLQFTCLENPMDIGAWWTTVCVIAKSWT